MNKIVSEFSKSGRTPNSSDETKNPDSERISSRVRRYENKMKRMTDVIRVATDSQDRWLLIMYMLYIYFDTF